MRAMDADKLLDGLRTRLETKLPGLARTAGGLRAPRETSYGSLTLRIDWDADAESCRVAFFLPPPAGGGPSFLVFCLSTTAQYWDVKLGLDDDGMLVVHADVEAALDDDLDTVAELIVARAETMVELLDDDYVPYLLEHGLGTPAQRARWKSREDLGDEEDEKDE